MARRLLRPGVTSRAPAGVVGSCGTHTAATLAFDGDCTSWLEVLLLQEYNRRVRTHVQMLDKRITVWRCVIHCWVGFTICQCTFEVGKYGLSIIVMYFV